MISAQDVDTIYAVPAEFAREGLDEQILQAACNGTRRRGHDAWMDMLRPHAQSARRSAHRAWWASMLQLEDAYKSLREALIHGGLAHNVRTVIEWIEAEELDSSRDGGGAARARGRNSGARRIRQARHSGNDLRDRVCARRRKIPFFGICLGMQCATIEYARDVCGLGDADSTEFDPDARRIA